ncbi:MAG: DUF3048 domain-containing protein [Butyrivibrio sp.]|nr:DUF3048 domain-containing protein [Muribaculum sp.]MCM1553288.1 DUF3048 domain-containing protein [Butyrivibrio sp.]
MKKKIIAAILIGACVLTACGQPANGSVVDESSQESTQETSEAEPSVTEESPAEEEPSLMITERVVKDGKMQSYLSGEWLDEEIVKRRPIAIMIPNNPPAMPQYGLSKASIIYEAPVEGRITRLMGVFEDYDDLDYIGPIRSSRDYFIYEAMALDAIYCNWGLAVPYVADLINSDRVDNISQSVKGIASPYTGAFARRKDRINGGFASEFTAYMWLKEKSSGSGADAPDQAVKGYTAGVEAKGYGKTYEESGRFEKEGRDPQAFLFANDCKLEYEDYPDAIELRPGGAQSNKGGYGQNNACFTYNEEDGLYYRSQYGAKQIDELTGEQLAVTNVVFKVCHGEVRDDHDYLAFAVHGTGDAYVFTSGKMIKATWEHSSDYDANHYYDENGNEIILNQGATWFCNIWKEYAEYAEVDGKEIFTSANE